MATAFILLNSTSRRFPNGLGNGSDQVGRNLMDHHKGLSISAEVPGFENSYYMADGPMSSIYPAYHFAGDAYRGTTEGNTSIGASLKEALTEPGNVFTTDGSCMTSSACLNPGLTYMAITAL